MKRPAPAALAMITIAALALAGCASSTTAKTAPSSAPSTAAVFPVTVDGTTVTAKPTHIVSLSATATDMLFAVGAGSQVVAVDKYSDYFGDPKPATTPPANLDASNPSAEAISALGADLVVIANDTNKIQEQLTKLNIPVYLAPAAVTIDDTYKQETALGALTGNPDGATKVVTSEKSAIAAELTKVPKRAKPLSVYVELDPTLYSVTSKTLLGSMFTMAGMTDIADPSDAAGKSFGYPQLNAEIVIKANPDMIFLADTDCCQQTPATVAARPGWSTLSAVQNHHVVSAGSDDVASQWGTRLPDLLTAIVNADVAIPVS
jgi:iron complex transport system substrate-binding protein